MDVAAILKQILEITDLTQAEFSRKVSVSQGTISKWINDGHTPNMQQWDRVVRFMKRRKDLRGLLGPEAETNIVPVMGFIGAGSVIEPEFEQVPPEGLDQIDLPFDVPAEIIAFRVRGDSMRPTYKDGDAVLVWRDQRADVQRYVEVGDEVAVRTADGHRYLKEVESGSKRGLFNLRSHNASLIRDVAIEWVGEIFIIVKASQIRKANKAADVRQARPAR